MNIHNTTLSRTIHGFKDAFNSRLGRAINRAPVHVSSIVHSEYLENLSVRGLAPSMAEYGELGPLIESHVNLSSPDLKIRPTSWQEAGNQNDLVNFEIVSKENELSNAEIIRHELSQYTQDGNLCILRTPRVVFSRVFESRSFRRPDTRMFFTLEYQKNHAIPNPKITVYHTVPEKFFLMSAKGQLKILRHTCTRVVQGNAVEIAELH